MSDSVNAEKPEPAESGLGLGRLIAERRVSPSKRSSLPAPRQLMGDPKVLSLALEEIRGTR
jgi:hypothetical protein